MLKNIVLISILLGSATIAAHGTKSHDSSIKLTENSAEQINRPTFSYTFPELELIDHRNQPQQLGDLFDHENNVVFAFFFSHCVSICTTTTLSLQSIQPRLPEGTLIAMISIDPETDTPELLSSYAEQFQIEGPNWYLLTGTSKQITGLQKSFEAYSGNKMNHNTSIFVKKSDSNVITEIKSDFAVIPKFLENS